MGATALHPIWSAARQQAIFRRILEAMAYPGRCIDCRDLLEAEPLHLAVLATMLDHACSFADPAGLIEETDLRLLDSAEATAAEADWLLMPAELSPGNLTPRCGSIQQPEASCTLVLEGLRRPGHQRLRLYGPGIDGELICAFDGIDPAWWQLREQCCARAPMGIDLVLCLGTELCCLPRTTRIEILEN